MKEWDAWEDWEASEWDVDCSPAEATAVSDDDDRSSSVGPLRSQGLALSTPTHASIYDNGWEDGFSDGEVPLDDEVPPVGMYPVVNSANDPAHQAEVQAFLSDLQAELIGWLQE